MAKVAYKVARRLSDHKWITKGIGSVGTVVPTQFHVNDYFIPFGYGPNLGTDIHFTRVAIGTGHDQRIGNRIRLRSLHVRMHLQNTFNAAAIVQSLMFRILICVIKTPMAYADERVPLQNTLVTQVSTGGTSGGTFQGDNPAAMNYATFLNPDSLGQLDIICERWVHVENTGPYTSQPQMKFVEINCPLRGMYAEYGDTNGTFTSMYSNAIVMYIASNCNTSIAALNQAAVHGLYTLRYDE